MHDEEETSPPQQHLSGDSSIPPTDAPPHFFLFICAPAVLFFARMRLTTIDRPNTHGVQVIDRSAAAQQAAMAEEAPSAASPTEAELEAAIREALEGAALEDITQRSLRATVCAFCIGCWVGLGSAQGSSCFRLNGSVVVGCARTISKVDRGPRTDDGLYVRTNTSWRSASGGI